MTATGHAVIGVVIAAKIGNPYLAIPLAIASHIVADAFPHWDVATNSKKKKRSRLYLDTFADVTISFAVSYLLFTYLFPKTDLLYGFLNVIAAQGLDWVTGPYYFLDIKLAPFTWAYKFQKLFDNRLDKPWGIISQVAVLLLLLIVAKLV